MFFKRFARGGPDKKPEFTAAMSGYANGSGEPSHPLRAAQREQHAARARVLDSADGRADGRAPRGDGAHLRAERGRRQRDRVLDVGRVDGRAAAARARAWSVR